MTMVGEVGIRVTRWKLRRLNFGRALAPITIVIGTVARRTMWHVPLVASFALMAICLGAMISARRRFGRRMLVARPGLLHLRVGAVGLSDRDGDDIRARQVNSWTWDGVSGARLYGSEYSWHLRSSREDGETLRELLRRQCGAPYLLRRRGTPRARMLALVVALGGVSSFVLGATQNMMIFVGLGTVGTIFGLAAFGAFSQRVIR